MTTYALITLGGAPVANLPHPSAVMVQCAKCNGRYPMAADPQAFGLSPAGAVVLVGYVETCPHCLAAGRDGSHWPGEVLAVVGMVGMVGA